MKKIKRIVIVACGTSSHAALVGEFMYEEIAKIPTEGCSCEDVAMKNAVLAWGLYLSLIKNAKCGNITNVTNLLARLTKICSISNCNCN